MLGKTGLEAGEIGVGCWPIGGPFVNLGISGGWSGGTDREAKEGLVEAAKMGANLFDTADVYGFGRSERLLGWLLRRSKDFGSRREDFVIVSKTGYFRGCAVQGYDPLQMWHQLEMSLQNLGTDYIDIYFFHHLDFGKDNENLPGAVEAMTYFKERGMIRFVGLRGPHEFSLQKKSGVNSGHTFDSFRRLAESIRPDVVSVRYNMITPTYDRVETDIFHWARRKDIGILIYKPLGQGLLLDKYDPGIPPTFPVGDHRIRKGWFRSRGLRILHERLNAVKEEFGLKTSVDLVQLCVRYCLSRDARACVLVGFKNKYQIQESLSARGQLNEDDIEVIKQIFEGVQKEIGEFTDHSGDVDHGETTVS